MGTFSAIIIEEQPRKKVCLSFLLYTFGLMASCVSQKLNVMVFFIPGTDAKIFQGARRVFTFHIEIFSLLSELANSVMKRSNTNR